MWQSGEKNKLKAYEYLWKALHIPLRCATAPVWFAGLSQLSSPAECIREPLRCPHVTCATKSEELNVVAFIMWFRNAEIGNVLTHELCRCGGRASRGLRRCPYAKNTRKNFFFFFSPAAPGGWDHLQICLIRSTLLGSAAAWTRECSQGQVSFAPLGNHRHVCSVSGSFCFFSPSAEKAHGGRFQKILDIVNTRINNWLLLHESRESVANWWLWL